MADPRRFERLTFAFGGRHSIQPSYGSLRKLLLADIHALGKADLFNNNAIKPLISGWAAL